MVVGGLINVRIPLGFKAKLPPFPFVAELYLGNNSLSMASTLVNHPESQAALWEHARLVAFDVPGCGPEWTYDRRYDLLRHVVAAWSKCLLAAPGAFHSAHLLPLRRGFPSIRGGTLPRFPN